MAVGKNFFKVNAENLMQLAVLLSVTRPDLQTNLQNPIQPLQEIPGGYNWTGPYITHGSTSPFNYENINHKSSAEAMEQNINYFNDLLNLHDYRGRYEEFINMQGGIASQNEAFDTESGYSSDHGSLSPPPSSASPHRDEIQTNSLGSQFDLSQLGASGFTPDNIEDPNFYKLLLDTFQDGFDIADYQEHVPHMPIKAEPLSPFSQQEYGTSYPLTKGAVLDNKAECLEDESFYHDPNQKNTLEQIGLHTNLPEEIFDPFSINWSSPSSNATGASFNPENSLVNDFQFDVDSLTTTWADDFNLPLDILKTEEQIQLSLPSDSSVTLSGVLFFLNNLTNIVRNSVAFTVESVKSTFCFEKTITSDSSFKKMIIKFDEMQNGLYTSRLKTEGRLCKSG